MIYQHYKGNYYKLIQQNIKHSETGEDMVLYQCMLSQQFYVRPQEMFFGKLDNGEMRFNSLFKEVYIFINPANLEYRRENFIETIVYKYFPHAVFVNQPRTNLMRFEDRIYGEVGNRISVVFSEAGRGSGLRGLRVDRAIIDDSISVDKDLISQMAKEVEYIKIKPLL